MRRTLGVVVLLLLAARAFAGDPPPPAAGSKPAKVPTPEEAADAVGAAAKAKDGPALRDLAARDDPDPWIVADVLLGRAASDAAALFAKAAPRPDVARLPEYVAARAGRPDDAKARAAVDAANAAFAAGKPSDALEALGSPGAATPADVLGIRRAFGRGIALASLGRLEESTTAYLLAADGAERLGWIARTFRALAEGALCAYRRADYRRALPAWERHLALARSRGDLADTARTLGNLGVVHFEMGDYPRALEYHEQSLALAEQIGDQAGIARAHGNLGNLRDSMGDFPGALEQYGRALKLMEEIGDRAGAAATLGNLGNVRLALGDYAGAIECGERALAAKEALGDKAGVASTLGNLGLVHDVLGDFSKALAYQERALKMKEALDDRAGAAATLGNLGLVHEELGEFPKALECQKRALAMKEQIGDRAGAATTRGNIAVLYERLGQYAKALEMQEQALKAMEDIGDREGAARTLGNIGVVADESGDHEKAVKSLDRAVREAERIRADPLLAWALRELARSQLAAGEPSRALLNAKRGVGLLERMLGGLAEDQGAHAREPYADLFAAGALAAARADDTPEVAYFLESGRAGTLMESLGGRQALRWQSLPEGLRRAEDEARAAESAALVLYTRALDGGDRSEVRARLESLDAARGAVDEVVARIQRDAKKAASVFYPRAATLEEMQRWLEPGEALVLYGLCLDEAMAMVVSRAGSRVVALGKAADLAAACEALDPRDAKNDPAPAIAALRRKVVAPLGLPDDATRILVSPEGPLSYVPIALLFPDREVAYEPSGTAYGLLLSDAAKRGQGILAVGDPDYRTRVDSRALAVYASAARGGPLAALPRTRDEAKAVGDVTLLGSDASEAGLRTSIAGKKGRWHGIHLACHGLVDPERPMLSSLALTPDAENDGFLTALEVLRMDIPSDLVVLSACETGRGKIVRGEGIVGLARAFMFAGAPRVIASLWKVDDEATGALMARLYALWNPKDGSKPLGTAAALRAAQEYVRTHATDVPDDDASKRAGHPVTKRVRPWEHPYYWAAWVLWGLPR